MRAERERAPVPEVELDAEREVDLAHYGWAILSRWWLVIGAIAAGAVIGWLVSLGGGDVYQARATVYPGQPLTPSSNAQVQSQQTNPSTINQIVRSESVVQAVAADVGVPGRELRTGISTKTVAGAGARTGQAQLVEITVRGPWRRQSAQAANRLAETAVARISTYPDAKIEQLTIQLESLDGQIAARDAEIGRYRSALEGGAELTETERLVLLGLLGDTQSERGSLIAQKTQTELSLALARDVERAQIVSRATASQVAARSSRTSIVVGAVIGLVVGVALALLWDPVRRRLQRNA